MAKMYKRFAEDWKKELDFSDEAKEAFYNYESRGEGKFDLTSIYTPTNNGYAIGKKWMDWQISEWRDDLRPYNPEGTLCKFELYEDYPK